jgi:hypothetical protein
MNWIRRALWFLKTRVFQRRRYRHGIPIDEVVCSTPSFVGPAKISWEIRYQNGSTIRGVGSTDEEIKGQGGWPGPGGCVQ